ncbi:CBS domain-containing protein [Petroclostridium sp. X23]|uniref:CBS domain-containing protein n=1 Tax=Petroclostridium sp. X23 TaxID=3045146 RepID=UPI0024AE2334|nr:CBS domain-containing protein [Petroclostridium sp. X23]WHH61727.1 CBS domain-containing protein [Petroclostridium sp. X23]
MQLKDIMTSTVVYVSPDTPVEQVAQLMQKHNVGSIPVCDASGVKGIVTDRDIVVRNVAHGTDPKTLKASDVMTSQITTAWPGMDVREASKMMAQKQIRRLPIVENNTVVGMVALGDLAVNPTYDTEASEALTEISTPAHPYKV